MHDSLIWLLATVWDELRHWIAPIAIGGIVAMVRAEWRNRPLRRVLNISPDYPCYIVVVERLVSTAPGEQRVDISWNDYAAALALQKALLSAGAKNVEIVSPSEIDGRARRANIFVVCSPKSNPIGTEFLQCLRNLGWIDFEFIEEPNPDPDSTKRWQLRFAGQTHDSPSYAAEARALVQLGLDPFAGPLHDVAVLARVRNPYNERTVFVIAAGIRGIGTQGAAEYLRDHIEEIYSTTEGEDFALLLKVTYAKRRVSETEVVGKPIVGRRARYWYTVKARLPKYWQP